MNAGFWKSEVFTILTSKFNFKIRSNNFQIFASIIIHTKHGKNITDYSAGIPDTHP